jgi:SAM-dependent methyltransferase
MATTFLPAERFRADPMEQLPYFVDWRPLLWGPAVRWLLGDPGRFRGKKVLDLGTRTGRMACLFGLLGARALGVDLPAVPLDGARSEAERWGVSDRVRFLSYSGDSAALPEGDFDFVFTKSVLVMIPAMGLFLAGLAPVLRRDGELLAAENLAGGALLNFLRRAFIHRRRSRFFDRVHGVDAAFRAALGQSFEVVAEKRYWGIVSAIRARVR